MKLIELVRMGQKYNYNYITFDSYGCCNAYKIEPIYKETLGHYNELIIHWKSMDNDPWMFLGYLGYFYIPDARDYIINLRELTL